MSICIPGTVKTRNILQIMTNRHIENLCQKQTKSKEKLRNTVVESEETRRPVSRSFEFYFPEFPAKT